MNDFKVSLGYTEFEANLDYSVRTHLKNFIK